MTNLLLYCCVFYNISQQLIYVNKIYNLLIRAFVSLFFLPVTTL